MKRKLDPAAEIQTKSVLNCRGMRCPLPVIYTRRKLDQLPSGELLTVVATDPGSVTDFAEYFRRDGVELVTHREDGGDYIFIVRKL